MGAAASAQFGPTLDAEAMKPADGSDLVDYNAARAEAVHLRRFLAALRQQVANDGVTAAFEHRDDQGTWHRYAPEQSVLIAVALGQNPNGAAKLPGGPFEVRFGDFATSRKMATAPDTGMVQVNTASDNTRVVRPQLWACTAFALQGPAGWQVLPTAACRGIAAAIANAPDGGTVVIPNTPTEIRWGHAARTAAHPDVPSAGVIAVNLRGDFVRRRPRRVGPYGRPVVPGPASYGMGQPAARPMPGYGQPMQPGYGAGAGRLRSHRAPSRAPAGSPTSSASSPRCAAGRPGAPGQPKPQQQQQQQQQGGKGSSAATNAAVAFGAVSVAAAAGAGGVLAVQNADQISAGVNDAGQWVSGGASARRAPRASGPSARRTASPAATNQAAPAIGNAAGTAGQWTVGAANDVSQFATNQAAPAIGGAAGRRVLGHEPGAPAIGNAAGTAGQWTVGAANDVSQFATNQAAPAIGNAAGDDATQWGAAAGMDAGQWGAGAAGDVGQWGAGAAQGVGQWGAGAGAAANFGGDAAGWAGARPSTRRVHLERPVPSLKSSVTRAVPQMGKKEPQTRRNSALGRDTSSSTSSTTLSAVVTTAAFSARSGAAVADAGVAVDRVEAERQGRHAEGVDERDRDDLAHAVPGRHEQRGGGVRR
ncbi:D-arabinose 1-dehydrogenase [Aureococcus anophagefferens]|nr:D-arabinose 1-dehydrogenase [Aureococcus anophagefferens]